MTENSQRANRIPLDRKLRLLRLLLFSLAVAIVVSVMPAVAIAGPLPASLAGEDLQFASGTGTGSATCTSTDTGGPGFRGSGSETFSGGGPASGSYPGTFTAQGTISVSADATTFDVNETFTITSSAGTVTGIKQGTAIPIPHLADGTPVNVICQIFTNQRGTLVPSLSFTSLVVPWSATISTGTGIYSDSGHSTLLAYTGLFGSAEGSSGVIIYHPSFDEQFSSSNGVAPVLATPTLTTQAAACCISGDGARFQPGAGTTAGGGLADTATLAGGNTPTGSITFSLYGPNDPSCSAAAVSTSSATVSGNGSYSSGAYTAMAGGTYRWIAAYGGDANNNAATTACNDVNESSVVTACPLSLSGGAPCGEQFAAETTGYQPPTYPPGFGGSVTIDSKSCNADGSGSMSFTADGTATGPYPGTFHETGTIVLLPSVNGTIGGTSYESSADFQFTITSPVGNVAGTKTLSSVFSGAAAGVGSCSFEPAYIDPNMFLNFNAQQQLTYQATITTAEGQFSDSGTGGSTAQTSFQSPILTPPYNNVFTEGFTTSNGVVPITSDTDLALSGVPGNITTNATSSAGAAVTYTTPTATDEAGDATPASASCAPASGTTFPIGTTTVTCTATDGDDLNGPVTATFTVTVVNDSDLALSGVPANITTNATSSAGAAVTYATPTATDEAGDATPATATCVPGSGSTFPIGTTTVTCTAASSDDRPSTVSATFIVTVTAFVDLRLAVSITPAIATTGTVVTASISVTNTASVSRTVTLVTTLSYVSPTGQTTTITGAKVTFTLAAGQTLVRSFTFKVPSNLPRGTYSFSATASDVTGSVSSSAKFTVK